MTLTPEQEAIARRTELRIEWEIRHPKSTKDIHEKVLAAVRDAIARALQAQSEATARLRDCLERLVDHQNGCPLPKYEKEWNAIMAEADKLLGRVK